jgi:hypothetical protein
MADKEDRGKVNIKWYFDGDKEVYGSSDEGKFDDFLLTYGKIYQNPKLIGYN